ncbi:hypothetical protein HKD37_15G043146 [Glycine soja]
MALKKSGVVEKLRYHVERPLRFLSHTFFLGDDASWLDLGAPTGGARGPSNVSNGAGAVCFLLFFVFFFDLGAETSVLGATTGVGVVGVSAGGELTGTSAGGELTGVTAGGVAAGGVVAGGVVTGGVVARAGAAALDRGDATMGDETRGFAIAALGDEAGGDEVGEATGAVDFGLEGVVIENLSSLKQMNNSK